MPKFNLSTDAFVEGIQDGFSLEIGEKRKKNYCTFLYIQITLSQTIKIFIAN